MSSDRFQVGPFGLADTVAYVDTNDADFAAIAEWSFRDLSLDEPADISGKTTLTFLVIRPNEGQDRWGMWLNGEPRQTMLAEDYVLFHLQWEFNNVILERRHATIHAAAIEVGGRAFILCGSSMSGKTTLAGWMAAHGAGYIADEIVALTDDSRAMHYRRPLGLRHGGPLERLCAYPPGIDRRFDRYEMLAPVSALGDPAMPEEPLAVGGIVFPRFDSDRVTRLEVVQKSVAFERVCENAPGIANNGRPVFHQIAALVREVPTFELVTTDLARARQLLLSAADETTVSA